MKRFLAALTVALVSSTAFAQVQTQTPSVPAMMETISVTGTGRSTVTPDRVTFTVGVQSVAQTVEEAVNQNNAKVAAAIAALKRTGLTDQQIRTANFSIYPQQDYREGKPPQILGYQVANNITVTSDKVASAGKALQAAVGAGVNTSSGLQFEVSDPSIGREQGLKAAYTDARAKATVLAKAAGRNLGRAMMIAEGAQVAPPQYPRAMAMRAEAAQTVSDVPVESGSQENSYTVSVVFELR